MNKKKDVGFTFWYIDSENKIQHANFDPADPIHKKCEQEGNMFHTSQANLVMNH